MSKLLPGMTRDIAVVCLPGTFLSSVGAFLDGFALVARQVESMFAAPYRVTMTSKVHVLTTSGKSVRLACGRSLDADADLDAVERFQLVYLAAFENADEPSLTAMLKRESGLLAWLARQQAAGAVIGGAAGTAFMLAEAGLLDKGAAAVPRGLSDGFRRRYPHVRLETRMTVVEHQDVFTTAALANEWMLIAKLIERIMPPHMSRWLASATGLQRVRDNSLLSDDPLVAAAQFWLGERFTKSFRISDLARDLAVSHVTLIRRFERSLSMTPRRYAQTLRMEAAKNMVLRGNRSIEQISTMVGYADMRSFRAAFREYAGMSPTSFRAAAGK